MGIKILHIAPDDKFISAADYLFESAFPEAENQFIIVKELDDGQKLKHVKLKENYSLKYNNQLAIKDLANDISDYQIVVLHFLLKFSVDLINITPSTTTFLWIIWGRDIYESDLFEYKLYGDKTYKNFVDKSFIYSSLSKVKRAFGGNKNEAANSLKKKAIEKVKLVGAPFAEEFQYFKDLGLFSANTEMTRFVYYPLELVFKNNLDQRVSGNSIQIGNSATATNNHLEIFDLLSQFDIEDRKLIVPLSYGDKKYGEAIVKVGAEKFQSNFVALKDFMPLEEYQKLMSQCSIVIMNHYRQQAFGNILSTLWMGAKVYLDEASTIYQALKRMGCYIYLVKDDLQLHNKSALLPLSEEQVAHNRKILSNFCSTRSIVDNLKNDLTPYLEKQYASINVKN